MTRPEKVLTDDLWHIVEPLLPKEKPLGTPGRPMVPNKEAMKGIIYVLLNDCPWNALPKEYPSPSTCWRRLRDWQRRGVWKKIWLICLEKAKPDISIALINSSSIQASKGASCRPKPNR